MGCWVVPTIAADLWGVPLESVLNGIEDGSIPSRKDHGFVVVHTSRDSAIVHADPVMIPQSTSTYAIISVEEEMALLDDAPSLDSSRDPELAPVDEETASYPMPDWHEVRATVSRTRRGPKSNAA